MAITVNDIMKVMDNFAPLELTQAWDNCGLVVGDVEQEVGKLYIAIDPTLEVINEAIRCHADMIVTHHPLMLHKINQINSITQEGKKILKLIKNNVSLYCAHTNLDQTIGGLNDLLAEKIGLKTFEVLEVTGKNDEGKDIGFGRIGDLDEVTDLYTLAKHIEDVLGLKGISIIGDGTSPIKKVAVGSGSGMEALSFAVGAGADVFITGDIKYHGAIEANELDICLIDATHFGTENIVRELLEKLFSKELPELELLIDYKLHNPIEII